MPGASEGLYPVRPAFKLQGSGIPPLFSYLWVWAVQCKPEDGRKRNPGGTGDSGTDGKDFSLSVRQRYSLAWKWGWVYYGCALYALEPDIMYRQTSPGTDHPSIRAAHGGGQRCGYHPLQCVYRTGISGLEAQQLCTD